MAFQTKTDYCGLVAATTPQSGSSPLVIKDAALNGSNEKYQPQGQDGSFLGTEIFGGDTAPTNNYGLAGTLSPAAGAIKLNKVVTIGTGDNAKKYALESISISTSAGSAPTISATCQEIESTATDAANCHYSVPTFTLTTKQHAQDIFGAVTIEGSGCSLTDCSAAIGGSINKEKVEGVKIASDINSGVITVSGNIISTSGTAPTVTANTANGWIITKLVADSESNPEAAYKTYSFEAQKILAKDVVVGSGN